MSTQWSSFGGLKRRGIRRTNLHGYGCCTVNDTPNVLKYLRLIVVLQIDIILKSIIIDDDDNNNKDSRQSKRLRLYPKRSVQRHSLLRYNLEGEVVSVVSGQRLLHLLGHRRRGRKSLLIRPMKD